MYNTAVTFIISTFERLSKEINHELGKTYDYCNCYCDCDTECEHDNIYTCPILNADLCYKEKRSIVNPTPNYTDNDKISFLNKAHYFITKHKSDTSNKLKNDVVNRLHVLLLKNNPGTECNLSIKTKHQLKLIPPPKSFPPPKTKCPLNHNY